MSLKSKILAGVFIAPIFAASAIAQDAPIRLTIEAPGGPILSDGAKVKNGKVKDKDANLEAPTLFEDGYAFEFRMAAIDSVALVNTRRKGIGGTNYETLVLDDPDGCLDLSHSFPTDLFPFYTPFPFESCPGGPDETFMNFTTDIFDAPDVRDESGFCEGSIKDRLVRDEFGDLPPSSMNTPYVDPRFSDGAAGIGGIFQVGPKTGGPISTTDFDHEDCYGFGADDDIPSLVVMANVGAARVFDENLVYDNTRIRNMAGLVSGVASELLDSARATAVVARMPVRLNMLRPMTFVDLDGGFFGPFPASVNITTQNDEEQVTASASNLNSTGDVVDAVFSTFPNDYEVEIRAVVVNGRAPEFIEDSNGDGAFTAADLTHGGAYELLSNEATITVNLLNFFALVDEQDGSECPPSSTPFGSDQQLYVDLDADGTSGVCQDGDGTSHSGVRVPR
ncbi:MAG: hypothetical protein HKN14_13360 [Marinicaulis sp.]|nr:hypothetical protein [Marinicaulis sp.]